MLGDAAIVVPLRTQQDDFLAACLDSAVGQTTPCTVLIVISDGTSRSNIKLIQQYQEQFRNVFLLRRNRESFAAAINTGIEAAEAARVGLLLSDDWLHPRAVERCLAHDADIVSTDMAIYDASGSQRLQLRKPRTNTIYDKLDRLQERASYLGHFLMFRRELLLSIGGVDEAIGNVGPDDFDMIWSLLEIGASAKIVEEELYCYRDHPGERLTLRPREDQVRDLEKILDKHGVFGAERAGSIERRARWFGRTLQEVVASEKTSG